jgi:hypothetical protein
MWTVCRVERGKVAGGRGEGGMEEEEGLGVGTGMETAEGAMTVGREARTVVAMAMTMATPGVIMEVAVEETEVHTRQALVTARMQMVMATGMGTLALAAEETVTAPGLMETIRAQYPKWTSTSSNPINRRKSFKNSATNPTTAN